MSKLLIVGTVAFDAIETPFGKTDKILGGAATYIGLSASNFNVDSAIVSVVGEDFPQEYLEMLAARNIDISGIEIVESGKTFYIEGGYGGYTGKSCDEYYEKIEVKTKHNFKNEWDY